MYWWDFVSYECLYKSLPVNDQLSCRLRSILVTLYASHWLFISVTGAERHFTYEDGQLENIKWRNTRVAWTFPFLNQWREHFTRHVIYHLEGTLRQQRPMRHHHSFTPCHYHNVKGGERDIHRGHHLYSPRSVHCHLGYSWQRVGVLGRVH